MLGKAPSVLFRQRCTGWRLGANSFFQNVPGTDFAVARFYLCRLRHLGPCRHASHSFSYFWSHISQGQSVRSLCCVSSEPIRDVQRVLMGAAPFQLGRATPWSWAAQVSWGLLVCRRKGKRRIGENRGGRGTGHTQPCSSHLTPARSSLACAWQSPVLHSRLQRRGWFVGLLLRVLLATTAGNVMGVSTENTFVRPFQNTDLSSSSWY